MAVWKGYYITGVITVCTHTQLSKYSPQRSALEKNVTAPLQHPGSSLPFQENSRVFGVAPIFLSFDLIGPR